MQNNSQIRINLPGSKSLTNRDLILSVLCKDNICLKQIGISDDSENMIKCLKRLGFFLKLNGNNVEIKKKLCFEKNEFKTVNKSCSDLENLESLKGVISLNVGQSGTSIKFLTALACILNNRKTKLFGDSRLNNRPIGDLVKALKDIGFKIECRDDNYPPIVIKKTNLSKLKSEVNINGEVSSQYISALLMIAPVLENGLEINITGDLVSKPYIDMTINEMCKFGVSVINNNYESFKILNSNYNTKKIIVEGDASALSYIANYVLLNSFNPKYRTLEISNIGNLTKQGDYQYLKVLREYFGLEYKSDFNKTVFKLKNYIQYLFKPSELNSKGDIELYFEDMPDVSMSFISIVPILVSRFFKNNTDKVIKVVGLQTLNQKESERIKVMISELNKFGVSISGDTKSITIKSGFNLDGINNITIETFDDHRIAMTFGVLKTYLEKQYDINVNILNPKCVRKTYPDFWKDIEYLREKS